MLRVRQGAFSGCAALEIGAGELGHGFQKSTHICMHTYLHPRTYIHVSAAVSRDRGGAPTLHHFLLAEKLSKAFIPRAPPQDGPRQLKMLPPILHALAPWAREPHHQKSDHYPLRATSRLSNQFPSETSHSSPPQACCGNGGDSGAVLPPMPSLEGPAGLKRSSRVKQCCESQ